MCRRITCPRCNRPSFAGCGAHVEQVLADVPRADRCRCAEERANTAPVGRDANVKDGSAAPFWAFWRR